jgi:hypothetical protein
MAKLRCYRRPPAAKAYSPIFVRGGRKTVDDSQPGQSGYGTPPFATGKGCKFIIGESGVNHATIIRDLAATNVAKIGTNVADQLALEDVLLEGSPTARGEADILAQAKEIRAAKSSAMREERIEKIAEIPKVAFCGATRVYWIFLVIPWE